MIKLSYTAFIIFYLIFFLGCSKKTSIDPETKSDNNTQTDLNNIFSDSLNINQDQKFFQLEQSMEDVQREIEILRNKVMNYDYKPEETNYTKQLKLLINNPPPSHRISLKNGSIIDGTIESDKSDHILINTKVGKLTLKKSDILGTESLVLPTPDIVFIGNGQEKIFSSFREFSGKIMNQGNRRADFVRIVYNLWLEDTQLAASDSTFIEGTKIIYQSGVITDTSLEPNESARFNIKISVADSISISYVTRDIKWEMFD